MSMNSTPAAERVHIAFFGVRNVGKSSVVNAVTGQELSIVSDVKGTTTDPVKKTMELLPIGPVVIIDTPGIDDTGALGEERVRRTKRILNRTDLAVLVVSAPDGLQEADRGLLGIFAQKGIPYLIVLNKTDLVPCPAIEDEDSVSTNALSGPVLPVSAKTGEGIWELKEALGKLARITEHERPLVADLVKTGDTVILVIPIDKSAPKGRLILPQQMVIRGLLDAGAVPMIVRDTEYALLLSSLGVTTERERPDTGAGSDVTMAEPRRCPSAFGVGAPPALGERSEFSAAACATERERPNEADTGRDPEHPRLRPALVITDSQVFAKIAALTPETVPLTSFSMLMARYKGGLSEAVRGARAIRELRDGDTVLISEGCTHHRQCEDIGTVKFPRWLENYTGKKLTYAFTAGHDFPEDLSAYRLVIHCGGCMLNEREMRSRVRHATDEGIPMTNYGTAIAEIHGILDRCAAPLLP